MPNTLVPVFIFVSMLLVAAMVFGVSMRRGQDRRRHRRRPSEWSTSRVVAGSSPADSSGADGFSTSPSDSIGNESGEALQRLRCWVEASERVECPATRPAGVPARPNGRLRSRDRTVRLVRRHRPAWLRTGSSEPMIRVLGQARVDGVTTAMTSQQQAVVVMLALHGPCSRDRLIDGVWGGRAVSDSRFANLLADIRRAIGRQRLVQNPDGRYELLDVAVDVERFAELVQAAGASSSPSLDDPGVQDPLDRLELAIGLIEGPIFESGHRRFWGWLDDGYHRRHETERMVVWAGLRAAALALGVHQPQRARWACERCLVAVPHDEALVTTLVEIHLVQGRRTVAAELVAGWEQAVRRLGIGEPSPGPRSRLVSAAPQHSAGRPMGGERSGSPDLEAL